MGHKWLSIGFAVLAATFSAKADRADVPIGTKVERVQFKDIRYVSRSLRDLGEKKVYVLVFTSTTCPVAQRYASRLDQLAAEFAEQGVALAAVFSGAEDSIQDLAFFALEYGLQAPIVKDLDGSAARALGATRTPEAVVLDADHIIRYRGRIDDQYRVSGVQPNVGRDDLRLAVEDVLAGRPVQVAETPVDGCPITYPEPPARNPDVTFAADVAPIIYKNCTQCHRPNTEAPFSLITYEDVSKRAKGIAEVITQGSMPPWFAHPEYGTWLNARGLSEEERRTLLQWALGDKKPGDLSSTPAPPTFPDTKWLIGEPDLVLTAEEPFQIPAEGIIDYQYVTMPYIFPEDTWVQGIQIQPSNPRVVHHANVVYTIPGDRYREDENFLTGRVPGGSPAILGGGLAFFIPKGAVLTVQIHYVTTGKPETDQMSVGIRYAKETITKRARHKVLSARGFSIPPGAPAHPVSASKEIECDATAVALFVHMHLRGRNSIFTAHYPDGKQERLLVIPNYSFDWQMPYLYAPGAKRFPKGTRIECTSQFDNSPFNPFNPDPTVTVEYGDQTFEEMMDGYVFYTADEEQLHIEVDPATGQEVRQTASAPRSASDFSG